MLKPQRTEIRTFDDFVEECHRLPGVSEPHFNIVNPLEQHFFNVADKHGVLDAIIDGDDWDD